MQSYFLIGRRLGLRPLSRGDFAGGYLSWLNDPEVNAYSGRRFRPVSEADAERYLASLGGDAQVLAICLLDEHRHIGNIKYGPVDWPNRCAEIEILIGDKAQWGKGYATEAIGLVTAHLFTVLRLHRVEAKSANPGFIRAVEKQGWTREGALRGRMLLKDGWTDYVLYSILEDEFGAGAGVWR